MDGLRSSVGIASPPFTKGPYTWDQFVTFTAGIAGVNTKGSVIYVDGESGSDGSDGTSWTNAKATIQAGVTAAGANSVVFVMPKAMAAGSSDPSSYAEKIIIPATHENLALVGINWGRTQGGLPQIKYGGTLTGALLTVRAPGCLIANIGFNGNSTAGAPLVNGILLDDNSGIPAASGGETKSAFGTTIINCHFKDCAGSTVGDARTGGAIVWSTNGGAFQVLIQGNRFYKNVGDIVLLGTSGSVPQDVVIEDNIFSGQAANVDCNLYLAGGSGMTGLVIKDNTFQQLPALSAGQVKRYIVATGCTGMLVGNTFGCQTSGTSGTPITFKVGGSGAEIPVTLHLARNFGQSITADATGGEISIA
jgi:hypothetical protein